MSSEPVMSGSARAGRAAAGNAGLDHAGVLLVSGHAGVQEQVARVVAAAGAMLHTVAFFEAVPPDFEGTLLVGADVEERGLPTGSRRGRDGLRVLVVGVAEHVARLWSAGEAVRADHVVLMPEGAHWLLDYLSEDGSALAGWGLGVMGASGGVGASALACALGVELSAQGAEVLLVDGDPIGGSIEAILGAELAEGARWPDLQQVEGALAPRALLEALPRAGSLPFLGWGAVSPAVSQGVSQGGGSAGGSAGARAGGDRISATRGSMPAVMDAARLAAATCVIDVGRWAVQEWSLLPWCDEVLLAVRPSVSGLISARNTIAYLAPMPVQMVLTEPMPEGFSEQDLAHEFGSPVAGVFRRSRRLSKAVEAGELVRELRPVRMRRPLGRILDAVGVLA